jgi:hypothetical protein
MSLARDRKYIIVTIIMLLSHGIYICIIIGDRTGLGLNGLGWATGRVSDCICLACVD